MFFFFLLAILKKNILSGCFTSCIDEDLNNGIIFWVISASLNTVKEIIKYLAITYFYSS